MGRAQWKVRHPCVWQKHGFSHTHTQRVVPRFIATLTGHVGAVYQVQRTAWLVMLMMVTLAHTMSCMQNQVCWSSDSRLLASASKDSTVKIWKVSDPKHAKTTLGGHADEVRSKQGG